MYEAFIDIAFLPNEKQEYSDIITMWAGDFEAIMDLIPLDSEGMYVALAFHYQVDAPWEAREDVPWELDELELSLNQLLYVNKKLCEMENDESKVLLCHICDDICDILRKAKNEEGRVFIKYYY